MSLELYLYRCKKECYDQLNVFQHHSLQHGLTDEVCSALVLVLPMNRTIEEGSLTLAVIGGSIVQLLAAIGTVHQTGKGARNSRLGFALSLLADDLHLVENVLFNNGFVGVLEDCLFFNRIRYKAKKSAEQIVAARRIMIESFIRFDSFESFFYHTNVR